MSKYDEIKDMSNGDFKRLTGVRKATFRKMVEAVVKHENERKKISGRPLILSYEDQVLMTLEYNREYRTYFHISADYGMSESNCYKLIKKTEDILVRSEDFRLPDRKKLAKSDTEIEAVLIDATEMPIERPQKRQKFYYSGKKRHTLKTQLVVNAKTLEILAVNFANGKRHDFRIFKESRLKITEKIIVNVDNGYLGIDKIHKNSFLPKKKSKKNPLSRKDKRNNKKLSRRRVFVEHVIGKIKIFKIFAERYRNRRKRFELRFKLIAGIYNFELKSRGNDF